MDFREPEIEDDGQTHEPDLQPDLDGGFADSDHDSGGAPEFADDQSPAAARSSRRERTSYDATRAKRKSMLAAIDKVAVIAAQPPETVTALAMLLGCDDNPAAVAVWSLTTKSSSAVVDQVVALSEADVLDAMVDATALAEDKSTLRSVWSLLAAVKAVKGNAPIRKPAVEVGRELTKAVKALTPAKLDQLRGLTDLLA